MQQICSERTWTHSAGELCELLLSISLFTIERTRPFSIDSMIELLGFVC